MILNKAFCFNMFSIPVKTYLGRDFSAKRLIMERILRDEIKLCTSQIQLKDGKIFWLTVFEFENEEHALKAKIAEASLSLEHPIVVKANNVRINIGSKEFLYRRLAIQASQKRFILALLGLITEMEPSGNKSTVLNSKLSTSFVQQEAY